MQIVIDIPESIFNTIQADEMISREQLAVLQMHILNSTPLPKVHGDLIDRSEVIKNLFDYHNGKKTIGQCIDDVQTIIEADTESEEEE